MNIIKHLVIVLILFINPSLKAQKIFTKVGTITFLSETPMEDIHAKNHQVVCVIDTETGEMQWSALIKSFSFEKALMQEHFNENYMESDQYPKAIFTGAITDNKVNWSIDGAYQVEVTGKLEMHGTTQDISVPATITITEGMISTSSTFIIRPEDYQIDIPKVVRQNIAEEVSITVSAELKKL